MREFRVLCIEDLVLYHLGSPKIEKWSWHLFMRFLPVGVWNVTSISVVLALLPVSPYHFHHCLWLPWRLIFQEIPLCQSAVIAQRIGQCSWSDNFCIGDPIRFVIDGISFMYLLYVCYDFSYFVLFTYVFSLFLEVSHGAAALTHFSLTHITATLV